jgi:type IV secretory pathway protease TraF
MIRQEQDTVSPIPPLTLAVSAWHWSTKLLAMCAVLAVCGLPWYQLNLTASAPRGVWLRSGVPGVVERGMWVTLPAPRIVKPWVSGWAPLLKPVAAVAEEQVCVQEETLWIMGRNYGPVYQAAQGRPLPHLSEGCFVVEAGQVFLASHAAYSLDSRYFHTVPVAALTARAIPLWTWR